MMKYFFIVVLIFVCGLINGQVSVETYVYTDTIGELIRKDSQVIYSRGADSVFFFHFQNTKYFYLKDSVIESERERITFGENYESINSFHKCYYRNGQVKSVQYFLNGNLYGPYVSYFKNGNVDSIGFYWIDSILPLRSRKIIREDTINKEGFDSIIIGIEEMLSVKDQTWEYYNISGQLVRKEEWSKGMLISRYIY